MHICHQLVTTWLDKSFLGCYLLSNANVVRLYTPNNFFPRQHLLLRKDSIYASNASPLELFLLFCLDRNRKKDL